MTWLERHRRWTVPLVFAVLAIIPFGSLLWSTTRVVSSDQCDVSAYFLGCRAFGFGEIAKGNLPLWNPYTYGGEPYLGNFQAGLLYPPNWLHLILPLATAINWGVAIHLFLAGYFTYLWCRGRETSLPGSLLAGCVFMFSGPYFLHIYAGHLPHVCVMVWTPLMLYCIDGLAREGTIRYALLGIAATTMQILAGHPQYVYYTGIAVSLYTLLCLPGATHRRNLLIGMAAMYVGAIGLSAVQLFSGIEAARESIRGGGGMAYEFASTLSLPPLNWLTLIAPQWLGGVPHAGSGSAPEYWGAGYLWESSVFMGVCPAVLAACSLVALRRRTLWPVLGLAAITAVLAMGRFTPLYRPLFNYLPSYNSFRGTAKFAYVTVLMLAGLSGVGFDVLLRRLRVPWAAVIAIAVVGLAAILVSSQLESSGHDSQGGWSSLLARTGAEAKAAQESFIWPQTQYSDPQFIAATAGVAKQSTLQAGVILLLVAGVILASRYRTASLYGLLLVSGVEMLAFAHISWAECLAIPPPWPAIWDQAFSHLPADQRVAFADPTQSNLPLWNRRLGTWGYDPNGLKRWAQFVFVSQGASATDVSQYILLHRVNLPMFQLMRCRFIFTSDSKTPIVAVPDPMAVAQLAGRVQVIPEQDPLLTALATPTFDWHNTVLLEHPPAIAPGGAADAGTVKVLRTTTDELELQADVKSPAILLVTNAYSRGWRAEAIDPSPQDTYDVIPADWALQGIPLAAGSHHLRLYYSPTSYRIGRWVTLISLLAYAGVVGWVLIVRRRRLALDDAV